jgi:hypothetical protein
MENENLEFSLYKLYNGKDSPTQKRKIFNEMPDIPGYEKVYMPYGEDGAGFYYKGNGKIIIRTGHFSITKEKAESLLNEMEIVLFGN